MKKPKAPAPPSRPVQRHYIHTACRNSSVLAPKLAEDLASGRCTDKALHCAFCQSYFWTADFTWADGSPLREPAP